MQQRLQQYLDNLRENLESSTSKTIILETTPSEIHHVPWINVVSLKVRDCLNNVKFCP